MVWQWLRRLLFQKATTSVTVPANRIAQDVIEQFREKKLGELRNQFHPLLRWMLPETILSKGFDLIRLTAGPIVDAGQPKISVGWFMTTVTIPVQFKNARLALSISMTSSGNLIGLRFRPSMAGLFEDWKPPSYVDESSFEERRLQIGTKYRVRGVLTLPKSPGPHPCIILIGGSGPCDIDSTVQALKPFKDLAWGLATQGVAVVRFDKVTYRYGGKFNNETITLIDEYDDQAMDAIRQAQQTIEIDSTKVFVLGHSLGAYVAPYIVARSSVAGLLIMAGPTTSIYRAAIRQMKYLGDTDDRLEELERQADVADILETNPNTAAKDLPFGIGMSYWLSVKNSKPLETVRSLQIPTFIMHGGRDYQVIMEDLSKWQNELADKNNVKLHLYEDLNHLFIFGKGSSTPAEYSVAGHVDKRVIDDIKNWIGP